MRVRHVLICGFPVRHDEVGCLYSRDVAQRLCAPLREEPHPLDLVGCQLQQITSMTARDHEHVAWVYWHTVEDHQRDFVLEHDIDVVIGNSATLRTCLEIHGSRVGAVRETVAPIQTRTVAAGWTKTRPVRTRVCMDAPVVSACSQPADDSAIAFSSACGCDIVSGEGAPQ